MQARKYPVTAFQWHPEWREIKRGKTQGRKFTLFCGSPFVEFESHKEMAEIETLGILDEVQSIVSDKLQVVSYKWLSRNFLVSSNAAKGLLQEFVEKYGNGLEVIYSLSGWLKNNPTTYHIRLVSKDKLSDAKQEFDGNCSVQVYSVQACVPKDPATLWNHEFVQAEDLFKQPLAVDNCLRDNRFCGVSNSLVKRAAGGTSLGTGTLQVKTTGVSGGLQSCKARSRTGGQLAADKEKVPQLLRNNKKGQNDKNSSGTGGALASMWGRASAKPKPEAALPQANNSRQNSAASAEAQICARESVDNGSSDEDGQDFNVKRTSNGESSRKRRVVLDYSDEEDEYQDAENKPKIKEKTADVKANQHLGEKVSSLSIAKKAESPTSDNKSLSHISETGASGKDKVTNTVPRQKVLKTRIDAREEKVVWEGEEPDTKSDSNSAKVAENNTATAKVTENNTANNAINRQGQMIYKDMVPVKLTKNSPLNILLTSLVITHRKPRGVIIPIGHYIALKFCLLNAMLEKQYIIRKREHNMSG
ncbi:hypothetical protein DH2020_011318 [Rehmannia glutinosa]|uniref:DNA polymerase delta subunit 3 n=1 Tax=Rehmannia glutinosa TaxID=99300 RepID=A0ABR0XD98_REHGL